MRKLVFILAAIFFGFSSFTNNGSTPDKALLKQIYPMLSDLPLEIEEEMLVEVKLKINHEKQIEILSVKAEDPFVRKLIKKRLNNKTLSIPGLAEGSYVLPIRIKL